MQEDYLENILSQQFQKKLEFELNGKIYKRGKFLLFRLETYNNNYEITFMFEKAEKKVENFKVPTPFKIEYYPEDGVIFFDYRVITLAHNDKSIETKLLKLSENYPRSKYFNSILKIHCKILP